MSRRIVKAILFCALFPLLSSAVLAQKLEPPAPGGQPKAPASDGGGTINSVGADMETVLALVKQTQGISNVEIVSGSNNYKAVRGQLNGTVFLVGPEICTDGVCRALAFYANLGKQKKIDLKWLNAWNSNKVFGRAYLDKEGNVSFDMAIHFWGGVNPGFITESTDLFGVLIKSLYEFQPGK